MLIIHDETLSQRLEAIADSENRSVEEVLRSLLATYESSPPVSPTNTSTWWAAHITELAFETESPIDPENADEILQSEFADRLWKRMNDAADSESD